jgi:methionyl aminopeptidase
MEKDIPLKTAIDVAHIRRSCRIVERTLHFIRGIIEPGISTIEIDREVEAYLASKGAKSALKGYRGYPKAVCTSVNNVAAHGIPSDYRLEPGDIISVDLTIIKDGWHGDAAWTYIISSADADTERLIRTAWQTNLAGIMAIHAGAKTGDIGHAISTTAIKHGCTVLQDYVGHGIGEDLHEEPRIPNVGTKGQGLTIVPGMVFTVEPIVTLGDEQVHVLDDGWTVVTADGSLAAQFEHTIAVFKDRIEILTASGFDVREHLDQPPYF